MEEIRRRLEGYGDGDNLSYPVHNFSLCTGFVPKYYLRRPMYFLFCELSFHFLCYFISYSNELGTCMVPALISVRLVYLISCHVYCARTHAI